MRLRANCLKLSQTLGQAIRIDGVTPAAVIILLSHIKKLRYKATALMQQPEVINILKKDLITDQAIEKLKEFINLVLKENKRHNLIAKSIENQIWVRHV